MTEFNKQTEGVSESLDLSPPNEFLLQRSALFWAALIAAAIAYCVFFTWVVPSLWLSLFFVGFGVVNLLFMLNIHRESTRSLAAHGTVIAVFAAIGVTTLATGDLSLTWFLLVPLISTYYLGLRAGVVWTVLGAATLLAFAGGSNLHGHWDSMLKEETHATYRWFMIGVAYLIFTVFALGYEWQRLKQSKRFRLAEAASARSESLLKGYAAAVGLSAHRASLRDIISGGLDLLEQAGVRKAAVYIHSNSSDVKGTMAFQDGLGLHGTTQDSLARGVREATHYSFYVDKGLSRGGLLPRGSDLQRWLDPDSVEREGVVRIWAMPLLSSSFGILGELVVFLSEEDVSVEGQADSLRAIGSIWVLALEHHRSIQDLQKALKSLERAEQIANMGSFEWASASGRWYWSPQMYSILGLEERRGEVAGLELGTKYMPLPEGKELQSMVQRIRQQGGGATLEHRLFTESGRIKLVQTQLQGLVEEGAAFGVIGICRDVSELRRSESKSRRLLELMDQASGAIVVFNAQAELVYSNSGFARLMGCAGMAEAREGSDLHTTENKFCLEIKQSLSEIIKSRRSHWQGELLSRRSTGESIWLLLTLSKIELEDFEGSHCEYVMFLSDITQLKTLEDEREEMARRVQHTAKLAAIGELAAGVAHEINNPMAIISGYVDIAERKLAKANPEHGLDRYFAGMRESVHRVARIVDGLRTYARRTSDEEEVVDTHHMIDGVLSFMGVLYNKRGINLKKQLAAESFFILGNEGKLKQVLVNLITNAKDAMEDGQGEITVRTSNDGTSLVLEVIDNGSGIPEEIQGRVFEKYFTTKSASEGTGLGLEIVREFVSAMHGQVSLESKVGKGTVFRLRFPTVADQTDKADGSRAS